ncbi:unnamed protein product [Trifolium pratense]|uniref:Uncharacterized protein n=1 Tax=Trifolium pratense TaxID=57577 RepID=A0ACB0LYC8_TRIPR|nr:unnamed protein product [Trifolium pratense]
MQFCPSTMTMFQYITLFVAIIFFIIYNIWRRNKNVLTPNWPIVGMLPSLLRNLSNIHDYAALVLKNNGGTFYFKGPWFTNIANFVLTSDPMNVHHITSKNFSNYGKGPDFPEIFEVLGASIITLDSNEWKQERTLLHSLLKKKSFETTLQKNVQRKLQNCLLPFLDHHASKGVQVLDLQDIFERFTFDITCTFLFGFDPNSFPYNFNEFAEIAYVNAISVLEDTILFRQCIPKCMWKLQKWLQIGQEKKNKVALENLHQFLLKCIISSKGNEEKRRLRSSEDVEESDSLGLLQGVMNKAELGKEEMDQYEKYIRDTAITLLAAGNGTISSGLSWFFWLVSTHPIVEAKIIQEIKDNLLKLNENLIDNLTMEKIDKLVYLHGVICEALRLYPPIPFEYKCAVKSDILPSGDHVSPNLKLVYSLYAMGRMKQIWGEDCLEFKPERWISDKGQIIHVPSYKFITFNAGPRSCLGKEISFIQMKMVAVAVVWKFHVQVIEGHSIAPRVSMILRMEHGFKVNVSKRCI